MLLLTDYNLFEEKEILELEREVSQEKSEGKIVPEEGQCKL